MYLNCGDLDLAKIKSGPSGPCCSKSDSPEVLKFKVPLNPAHGFAKSCILSCLLKFNNKKRGSLRLFLSYKSLKLKLRVFSRSYCCYGTLLCHKIDSNMLSDDWAVFFLIP